MNFIITEDKATIDELLNMGFQNVQQIGNAWLFLNDNNKMMFAEGKDLKFTYTNKMMF